MHLPQVLPAQPEPGPKRCRSSAASAWGKSFEEPLTLTRRSASKCSGALPKGSAAEGRGAEQGDHGKGRKRRVRVSGEESDSSKKKVKGFIVLTWKASVLKRWASFYGLWSTLRYYLAFQVHLVGSIT